MKVLLTHPGFPVYGGAERLIVILANYLTDCHIENTLVTGPLLPTIKSQFKETRILETKNPAFLTKEIIDDFDVINAHNNPAQLYHIPKRKPVVWMCNEPPISYLLKGVLDQKEAELVRDYVSCVVVADHFNQQRFQALYRKESTIIHYGIDFESFQNGNPQSIYNKYSLEHKFVISHVGYMTFTKNQLGTLDIFQQVKQHIPHAVLVFAGYDKDPYAQLVKQKIHDNAINDVLCLGELPQDQIRDLYYASQVVISPIKPQGGWLSVFEAMAAGRPVVVSNEMTASSILKENGIGFVGINTPFYDHQGKRVRETESYSEQDALLHSIAEHILTIYNNNISHDEKARSWVKEHLSWKNHFCPSMVDCFTEAINLA